MLIDFKTTALTTFDADVCIVGSGVAGITVARRLLSAGRSVTILESGGFDYEEDTSDLNAGDTVGAPYYRLDHARMRFFGGTTAIWGGRIAELDPIDFERREWVPYSGWPVSYAQMREYYDQSRSYFGLPERRLEAGDLREVGVWFPDFADTMAVKLWNFDSESSRFNIKHCRDLVSHPRCTILTHATATRIRTDHSGAHATGLDIANLVGRSARINARQVVLASGGIENPRLLLASNQVHAKGLGNAHDLVGRFFMEHPHARGGHVTTNLVWDMFKAYGRRHTLDGQTVAALLAAAEGTQRREGMLNTSMTIAPRQPADSRQFFGMRAYNKVKHDLSPTRHARLMWLVTKRAATLAQKVADPARSWLLYKLNRVEAALLVRAEQAPNPDSRVRLSGERDALGMPRVELDWRLTDLDVHSVDRLVSTFGAELDRLGLGKVAKAPWLSGKQREWTFDPLVSAHPIGGYHHMGTTRMAATPSQGVVDAQCRVHGVDNLYVAGSSVFPTSGWANPTFTIVALALRLADQIAGEPSQTVWKKSA
ncbi:GMC family oxidoreductase [Novosphingobium sp. YJ-S2-02]|uniref:GMC family oxidoreductase n=1 Tax=Novosphingobium aureum TaxID=2792964 RepID=A0A931MLP5_9SPHN|nr:GMC family oxidoreductase [Novosphingobium aureum]MBH0113605.1 GMC family oxidoreductase [Novosphingobium aureum]